MNDRKRRAQMNPAKIDRPSLALREKVDAKFFASSDKGQRLTKKAKLFWRALSKSERAKLKRMADNFALCARDIEKAAEKEKAHVSRKLLDKAAEKAGVSKELFDKWVSGIREAALLDVHLTAVSNLWWAKYARGRLPQGDSLAIAKLAAQNLKVSKDLIRQAAEDDNRRFFIDLGKCLSGEIKSKADEIDTDIAQIICAKPSIPAKDAVCELKKMGWHITEDAFRVRKQRLKRAASAAHEAYDHLLSTAKA
jgi:hypothetical protein